MRVIDVPIPGGPDALVVGECPIPDPGPDEVLIKVVAAGINRADVLQRRGVYPPPRGAPTFPGLEVSGAVIKTGSAVTEFGVGDQVCALLQGGGYAQYCAVPEGQTLPLPSGVNVIDAASLPEAYFTVWSNVFDMASLRPGESLLVHGGSSGIGTAAIQLANALGSNVFTTAGSEEKCRFCETLGAKLAINYNESDFVRVLREVTAGHGVNVVLDMVAGEYVQKNLEVLARGGRLVIIATQGGKNATIDVTALMSKRLTVTGSTLRPQPVQFKKKIKTELLAHVWPLFESGKLRPIVDKVFSFDQAAAAHAYMESSAHKGKILLRVDSAAA